MPQHDHTCAHASGPGRATCGRATAIRARSNSNTPWLSARRVNCGAGGAMAEVGIENCTQGRHNPRVRGRWSAEDCKARYEGERGDQGCARTVVGPRYAHAAGACAYCALLKVVIENVDAVAVVAVRAGRPVRGRAAERASEATAAMMTAVAMSVVVASWATMAAAATAAAEMAAVGRERRRWRRCKRRWRR